VPPPVDPPRRLGPNLLVDCRISDQRRWIRS
jgi:hypothetical protein